MTSLGSPRVRHAHGVRSRGDSCQWSVWAPRASQVELLLMAEPSPTAIRMFPGAHEGWFECELASVPPGQRYLYRLDGNSPRPDPASRWQPDGVHGASAVWRPDAFSWSDQHWSGVPLEELVIYELHVGTFTSEGTFAAIIPRLTELRSLGITAIELMPVGQFPGTRDWGYDGTYWFAVQNSYGGPDALQQLVDACHAQGFAVILDVVYNHFGPEGNYLGEFGPCFTARHKTPWGDAVNFDDEGCQGMRSLVLENVRQWFRDFHLDGLRLDAVHAIHDDSRPHILAEIERVAQEEQASLGRPLHIFAESNLNDVRLLDPPDRGGYGLSAQWNDDFHHCVHALLTGERDGYYVDFADPARQLVKALNDVFVFDGQFSRFRGRLHGRPAGQHSGARFIVSIQTHDQVGNRALGERLGTLASPSAQRLAACLLLLAPHIPLMFMGEEYGERRPFPFFADFSDPALRDAVRQGRREEFAHFNWGHQLLDPCDPATSEAAQLTWTWPAGSAQDGLRRLYRDLLHLRIQQPALRDFRNRQARLVQGEQGPDILELQRGSGANRLVCLFNLSPSAARLPKAQHSLHVLLRSEDRGYRGASDEDDPAGQPGLRPWECLVLGPCAGHIAPH